MNFFSYSITQQQLQDIAYNIGGGNRAMGTAGFNASGKFLT
jgi:hypothetical protein